MWYGSTFNKSWSRVVVNYAASKINMKNKFEHVYYTELIPEIRW